LKRIDFPWLEAGRKAAGIRLAIFRASGGIRRERGARAAGIGEPAVLRLGTEQRRGTLVDVGEDGSILLANAMGCMDRFTAGELFFGDG